VGREGSGNIYLGGQELRESERGRIEENVVFDAFEVGGSVLRKRLSSHEKVRGGGKSTGHLALSNPLKGRIRDR